MYSTINLIKQDDKENTLPSYIPPFRKIINLNQNNIIFCFMLVFSSVYFSSQALQCSNLISSKSHDIITSTSYVYNLLFGLLVSYFLFTYSQIKTYKTPSIISYWIFSTLGALGFALLGEISWLKDISITKGWLGRLTPPAFIVVCVFTIIIIGVGIKEYLTKLEFRDRCRSLVKIVCLLAFYLGLFIILKYNNATDIHYHVHHAIFSGILSLWFIDWDNYVEMVFHAIFMGIVVEGIDFYGIQELFLILFKDNSVSFGLSLGVALTYLIPMFVLICFYYKKED